MKNARIVLRGQHHPFCPISPWYEEAWLADPITLPKHRNLTVLRGCIALGTHTDHFVEYEEPIRLVLFFSIVFFLNG